MSTEQGKPGGVIEQFRAAREKHPGMLLLFRCGDFYELVDEDADTANKLLGLTLTTRDGEKMAGFPHHQLETYLAKLLQQGQRVAVCEPAEDARAPVRWEVARFQGPEKKLSAKKKSAREGKDSRAPSKRLRILCHRHALLSACQLVSSAASRGDVKPALRCIKFVAEGERCTLMGTDLEIGIRLDVRGVKVDEAGAALLPCDRLLAILRETDEEEMVIDAGPDGVSVRGNQSAFDMPAEDMDGFPEIPAFTAEKYHEITASALRDMIARTVFAVSAEGAVRFGATTGVLWELEGDQVALVATDGRRLALATGPAQAHGEHSTKDQGSPACAGNPGAIVSGKAMKLLARNLTEPDEMVRVAFGPNDVMIQTGQTTIYSRLVEGKFPSYRQVIPQKHLHAAKLVSAPLMASIRQAAIMADEGAGVNFKFAKRKLTLNAEGAESGKSIVELPVEFDGNKSAEIRFNSAYVTDMLRAVEPDAEFTLELMAPDKPAVFRQEPNYLYVLVPLVSMAA